MGYKMTPARGTPEIEENHFERLPVGNIPDADGVEPTQPVLGRGAVDTP